MRRWMTTAMLLFLLTVGMVSAAELLQNTECEVPAGEVVSGNLFVLCRDLVINGEIEGHLIGAALTTTLNGSVRENVYLLGGRLDISGSVQGDVHFAGAALTLLPESQFGQTDLFSVAVSTDVQTGTTLPGSVVTFGYQLLVNGSVGETVDFWGAALRIGGDIAGNIQASVGDAQSQGVAQQVETLLFNFNVDLVDPGLVVTETAQLGGQLTYRSVSPGQIDTAVAGEVVFDEIPGSPTLIELVEEEDPRGALQPYVDQVIREFTSLGFIGLIALLAIPQVIRAPIATLRRQPLSSAGVGILAFVTSFFFVFVLLVLSLAIVVILALLRLDGLVTVAGLLLVILNMGGISIFYFTAIFVSRVVLALAIGRVLLRMFTEAGNTTLSWMISLLIGVLLLSVTASLPVIGWVINALTLALGLGAILTVLMAQFRVLRETPSRRVVYTTTTVSLPPPVFEEPVPGRGMDNLPEGFKWWDE